jgi:hypothetical protein
LVRFRLRVDFPAIGGPQRSLVKEVSSHHFSTA